jgi:hypothetical protein
MNHFEAFYTGSDPDGTERYLFMLDGRTFGITARPSPHVSGHYLAKLSQMTRDELPDVIDTPEAPSLMDAVFAAIRAAVLITDNGCTRCRQATGASVDEISRDRQMTLWHLMNAR